MIDAVQVFKQKDQLWTTSLEVATKFGKRHDTVLRTIRNLECSDSFRLRNFAESSYRNEQGKEQPLFLLSRGGFSMVAMGFTGRDAVAWKEKFIAAFDAMESRILEMSRAAERRASREWQQARQEGKAMRQATAEALNEFVAYAKARGSTNADRYFIIITRMACRSLFVFEPGHERLMAPTIRDFLDASQLTALAAVEDALGKELRAGMAHGWPYKAIYQQAKARAHVVAAAIGKTPVLAPVAGMALPTSRKPKASGKSSQLSLWGYSEGNA
ncbi:MAG: phage regulatory protein, rha family [Solidesulfovibrio magneticus str. Maddingley MBC34]|uniref:Phage regulatory protein, rha family n=1 Tax=Solidesulfovibrio magneticus str. Maddingley MBC34 TaxID=1206767 RepID=K6GJE5_9BACT|nr:MAG: phage regulatory protein, rha family [Solidesulfovibrio magneticus str. Maddingley MBC34]